MAPIRGKTLAWVGDGNNVLTSLVHAAVRLDFALNIATPGRARAAGCGAGLGAPSARGGSADASDAAEAVRGADAVFADTWVSMGQDDQRRGVVACWSRTASMPR